MDTLRVRSVKLLSAMCEESWCILKGVKMYILFSFHILCFVKLKQKQLLSDYIKYGTAEQPCSVILMPLSGLFVFFKGILEGKVKSDEQSHFLEGIVYGMWQSSLAA